jgi:hypothetical protein
MVVNYISVLTQTYLTMGTALINLPKKNTGSFFHPENRDLILSLAASGFAFSFWNAINLRPSLMTDPGYQDQKDGLERNMNISLLAIGLMAGVLSLIYGKNGYVPSALMIATGAGMYIWTTSELNRYRSDTTLPVTFQDGSVHVRSMSVLYTPTSESAVIDPRTRRQRGSM